MEQTSEYKFFIGFIISLKGDDMININAMKKKSIGIKMAVQSLVNKDSTFRLFQPNVNTGKKHQSSIYRPRGQK